VEGVLGAERKGLSESLGRVVCVRRSFERGRPPPPQQRALHHRRPADVSQYEQHLRAVLGLPLGHTSLKVGASAMYNILGEADVSALGLLA